MSVVLLWEDATSGNREFGNPAGELRVVLEAMKDLQELLSDTTSGSSWLDGFSDCWLACQSRFMLSSESKLLVLLGRSLKLYIIEHLDS